MMDKVLTFYLNNNLFGIDIKLVKEINRNVEFTPVPDAQSEVMGLFNMRGQIVTIFNLAKMIGIKDFEQKINTLTCIILKSLDNDQNQVGFAIDKPGDVIDVDRNECELPPANVSIIESDYIKNVVKLDKNLLLIIEPDKIFKV